VKRGRPKHDDLLTPREWEVLSLIGEGLTNEQIAARLAISPNTAKFHVAEILSKLGVTSREEAVRQAERQRRLLPAFPPAWFKRHATGTGKRSPFGLGVAALVSTALVLLAGFAVRFFDARPGDEEDPSRFMPAGVDAPQLDPAAFRLTVCIDNDTWQKPSLEEQIAQVEADRRYAPWNDSLRAAFEASFHLGAAPATGRPNPLGKLVLFNGLWAAGSAAQLYADLEAGCPDEPNAVAAPNLVDLWLLGYEATTAALDHGRVVVIVTAKPAGFQAIQLRFPGPAADYAGLIEFEDASGKLVGRLE
jgi:DNA-binding CsgD family transcriptional regulator